LQHGYGASVLYHILTTGCAGERKGAGDAQRHVAHPPSSRHGTHCRHRAANRVRGTDEVQL